MTNETYNWRSNRATRLVWVRYNPETLEDVEYAKEHIEEQAREIQPWFLSDLIDLSEIDREEIENAIETE